MRAFTFRARETDLRAVREAPEVLTPAPDAHWRKSSFSNHSCVEAAAIDGGGVGVRDSKNPDAGMLVYTPDEWRAFLAGVRNGEFDSLAD